MQPTKKTAKTQPASENIAVRLPDDLLQAIDAEVERRIVDEAGDPVTRSMVIRDSLRRHLIRRGASYEKIENAVAKVFSSLPKCDSFGCSCTAMFTELDNYGQRKWWCTDHTSGVAVEMDYEVSLKAVPLPDGDVAHANRKRLAGYASKEKQETSSTGK